MVSKTSTSEPERWSSSTTTIVASLGTRDASEKVMCDDRSGKYMVK